MLLSRTGLSPVMVGRDAELTQLRFLIDAARSAPDAPPLAVVSGEAGVGKSRLLRELASGLDDMRILGGVAEEGDLARPYELLRHAVEPVVVDWDGIPDALAEREHALCHVLHPLLPDHTEDHGDHHEHTPDELQRTALELVRHVIGERPSLLVFEDLHWADAESVELFVRLAKTPGLPLAMLGTFRPEEVDRRHPLAAALLVLERQRPVTHVTLGRLSAADLAGMLEAVFQRPVPVAAVTALHSRTQGNPFFVEELVAACDCADPAELARQPLPWNMAEAVLRRVDDLPADHRRVLDTAASLGARITFDVLAAVAQLPEASLIAVLHVLLDRRLLVEPEPDVFAFRHALTREAVASQLLGREQRRIHETALDVLQAQGSDDLAALARHAAGARRWAELVIHARDGAGRAFREGSWQQALKLAELGLRGSHEAPAAAELELRATAADAALQTGRLDAAQRHAEQWRQLGVEERDAAAEAGALRRLAVIARYQGDHDRQRELLRHALAVAESLGQSEELAWCLAYRSQAHLLDSENDEAIVWAERALAMADAVGSPQVRAYALVNKGSALTMTPGHGEEGFVLLKQAREDATATRDVTSLMRALNNALWYLSSSDAAQVREEVRSLLAEAQRLADRYGTELHAGMFANLAVGLAIADGDLEAARREIAAGLRLSLDPVQELALCVYTMRLAVEADDLERAASLAATHHEAGRRLADTHAGFFLRLTMVALQARRGDRDGVRAALAELADHPSDLDEHVAEAWCEAVVLCAGALPVAELRTLLDGALAVRSAGLLHPSWVDAAAAVVAEHSGDHAEALVRYETVTSRSETFQPAWLSSEAHQGAARLLAADGQRRDAIAAAGRAVEMLERWPGWRRDEAQRLLRRLGGGVRSATELLTAREREVVALVTRGLTNREIAERLFIANKTVAVHVSNVLGKTGLSSRTELAAWALQDGLVEAEPA